MPEIKWIKLSTTMFDDEKIRLIQAMPESDAIIVIWVRLLTLAGKTNADGQIYINENMPYNEEMFSTLFNKPVNTIRLAIETLKKFEMIDIFENGTIFVNNWEKHQNIEGMDKIKQQNAERAKKYRERKKQKQLGGKSNVTSRDSNALDIDKELDIDIDINNSVTDVPVDKIPYKDIVAYLNEKAGTKYKSTGSKTQSLIKARWNEKFTLDDFKTVIDNKVADANNPRDLFQAKYLRPETLFSNKFEGYLNQKGGVRGATNENAKSMAKQYDLDF